MGKTELSLEDYTLPAAPLGTENPLPCFRAPDEDKPLKLAPNVPEEDRRHLGWQTGYRALPFRIQDGYGSIAGDAAFPAIVLENAFLKATFLPALGGRLVSLFHKHGARELLDRNPVLKFTNVALRNAWFSGGVEWNMGFYGHHFLTCSPLFAARIQGPGGTPALRLYEWDRLKGLAWHTDFHLPSASPLLFAHTRVVNPTPRRLPMYWWTNMAARETEDVRILAPAHDALCHGGDGLALEKLPLVGGKDISYTARNEKSSEVFFRLSERRRPWIAALGKNGSGIIETSTDRLRGRKVFAWGTGAGGRRWQEHLSVPGNAYLEIQAGLARTQMETIPMSAGETWDWTEAFGLLEADPKLIHGSDWNAALSCAESALTRLLPRKEMETRHAAFTAVREQKASEILIPASGWGALERRRLKAARAPDLIPACLEFPEDTLSDAQIPWLNLLARGELPEKDPREDPGEYMIQGEWEEKLAASVAAGSGAHWLSHLHLGIMRMERYEKEGAGRAWDKSNQLRPSCWALRNLAQLARQEGKLDEAGELSLKAAKLAPSFVLPRLARECLELLDQAGREQAAIEFIRGLPEEARNNERVLLAEAKLALKREDLDRVESILEREFLNIREGEMSLTDIWFAMWEKRVSAAEKVRIDDALKDRVRRDHPPPHRIDFRHA